MRHRNLRRVLQRVKVLELELAVASGFEQPVRALEHSGDGLLRHRVARIHGRVNLRDHRRERPKPGELRVRYDTLEQLAWRNRAAPVFVSATLAVQKCQAKLHLPRTEISNALAVGIHDY